MTAVLHVAVVIVVILELKFFKTSAV